MQVLDWDHQPPMKTGGFSWENIRLHQKEDEEKQDIEFIPLRSNPRLGIKAGVPIKQKQVSDEEEIPVIDEILDLPPLPPTLFCKVFKSEREWSPLELKKLHKKRTNKKESFKKLAQLVNHSPEECEEAYNTINTIINFFK